MSAPKSASSIPLEIIKENQSLTSNALGDIQALISIKKPHHQQSPKASNEKTHINKQKDRSTRLCTFDVIPQCTIL